MGIAHDHEDDQQDSRLREDGDVALRTPPKRNGFLTHRMYVGHGKFNKFLNWDALSDVTTTPPVVYNCTDPAKVPADMANYTYYGEGGAGVAPHVVSKLLYELHGAETASDLGEAISDFNRWLTGDNYQQGKAGRPKTAALRPPRAPKGN